MGGSSSLRLTQRRRTFVCCYQPKFWRFFCFSFFFAHAIFIYIKSLGPNSPVVHFTKNFWKNDRICVVWIHTPKGQINHDGLGWKFLCRPRPQSTACTMVFFILTTYFPHNIPKLILLSCYFSVKFHHKRNFTLMASTQQVSQRKLVRLIFQTVTLHEQNSWR